jgi:crotonobetainyl-CoA:carnitine CoA-transferase CaiB-like acyl-CoA transferase
VTICAGLNVLELGAGSIAASLAGVVLADAGARVIKVEPPEGDRLRCERPSGFLVWNRGKESVVADLRRPEGQREFRELAARADVVIEGFAPGTTRNWGIGADGLRAANPRLIHCSITAFGETGPLASLVGYDSIVAAKLGVWARGVFSHRPGATLMPVAWGSYGAGMQAAAGILAALCAREQTGRGQALRATLAAGFDPLDYFNTVLVQLEAKHQAAPDSVARAVAGASRFGVLLATRDGRFIQTSTVLPHQGAALCEVAGIGAVLQEPRFRRLPSFDTAEDAQAWEDLLIAAFRERDLADWLPRLEASPDIAFEVARTSEEGLDHPQILANGDVIEIEDAQLGRVRQVGPIGHFSRTPLHPSRSAPALGENEGPLAPSTAPAPRGGAPGHPFAGVTIVEFGYFYAMPFALAMAATLGARVIKLEDGSGDPSRVSFGPEVLSNKTLAAKQSLSLDLRQPEAQEIARQLIARADVFVTGFRSGVAEKLGLSSDALTSLNSRLLYVHAAGYGSRGPYAQRALYAQAAQAVAGSFGRQVGAWADPQRNLEMSLSELQAVVIPRLAQVVDGDSNAALALFAALALGIYHQQRTGEGQRLETSMIAGNAWAYSDDFCRYRGKPPIPLCDDEYFGTAALDRLYACASGTWLCLCVRTQAQFESLARALGLPELADDPRFATAAARSAHDAALIDRLTARLVEKSAEHWEAQLVPVRISAAAVSMQGQAAVTAFEPALRSAGLTVEVRHPLFGPLVRAAPPLWFSEAPGRIAAPCLRGEHNRALLAELGYSSAAIAALEARGVVVSAKS